MSDFRHAAFLFLLALTRTATGQKGRLQRPGCHNHVTFNAGLLVHIPNKDQRADGIAREYANLNADVICSQEFWNEVEMRKVIRASKEKYPYHYSKLHRRIAKLHRRHVTPACIPEDADAFKDYVLPCAEANGCSTLSHPLARAQCISSKCGAQLFNVTEDCVSCTFQNTVTSIQDSIATCMGFTAGRRFNPPGLMLQSQKRILCASYRDFFPRNRLIIQRGYIQAEIEDVGTVICTHFSADLPFYVEYDLPYGNYEEQQRAEMEKLLDVMDEREYVLAGDLNCSPTVVNDKDPEKNLTAVFGDNYQFLCDQGFQSPYLEPSSGGGKCTFCKDNPLTQVDTNSVLDHVLLKGGDYDAIRPRRILDSASPITLSDHYGVRVRVCDAQD